MKINISFFSYLLLIFAITAVVVAGVYYINFPSQMTIVYGILGTAVFLAVLAFACRPQLIKELFVNKKTLLWVNDIVLILIVISIGVLTPFKNADLPIFPTDLGSTILERLSQ